MHPVSGEMVLMPHSGQWQSNPSSSSIPIRRSDCINKGNFISTKYENEVFLTDIVPGMDLSSHFGQLCYTASLQTCPSTGHLDSLDPRVDFAQRNLFLSSNPDSPTFYAAMNGLQSSHYRKPMKLEIETLERQHTWVSCLRPKDHRVLKSTWDFKLKRLPDGTPY
jgi:hypothetical protein